MKIKQRYPTQLELKRILHYDRRTGVFRWRKKRQYNKHLSGEIAGCLYRGYTIIKIGHQNFPANRLAWIYMKGPIPANREVDHKDLNRGNNVWTNLRLATFSEQQANRGISKNNTSGFKGVTFYKPTQKWRAQICFRRKKESIGYFDTPELAAAAYKNRAAEHFGQFARVTS